MTKKEALNIIIREAKAYKKHLVNQSILIIYKDRLDNLIKYLEVEFYPDQFQHLTGIKLVDEFGNIRNHTALEFYHRCIDIPYLTEDEIIFDNPKTIDLKMIALPYITQITKITKMTGKYNERLKDKLNADYIVGGTVSCIGISKYDDKDTFFPRSCLKEDIRDITTYTSQVLAIFKKSIGENNGRYNKIVYHAKGVNLLNLSYPADISEKINLQSYTPNIKSDKTQHISNNIQTNIQNNSFIEREDDEYDIEL